jgi:hypothetical protein
MTETKKQYDKDTFANHTDSCHLHGIDGNNHPHKEERTVP